MVIGEDEHQISTLASLGEQGRGSRHGLEEFFARHNASLYPGALSWCAFAAVPGLARRTFQVFLPCPPGLRYTHCFVRRLALISPLLVLAACTSIPDTYAPPVQRRPLTGPEPSPVTHFTSMNAPGAEAHFVRGVSRHLEAGSWRWLEPLAELMFRLETTEHLRFVMEFAIPEVTFAQRGPVTISVTVNRHPLLSARYERGGEYRLEKPVPAEWLRTDMHNYVALEIDKPWIAPQDGAKLGFILKSAGFLQ